jgi:FKBP-type peptidyl-prolyl cis-trans isomerase SlpA
MRADSRVPTLYYAIGAATGDALVSTFGGHPATLALGRGELAPASERCLVEVAPGDMELERGAVVEFSGPDGGKHSGIVRDIDDHGVRVDFSHPLAGCPVRFEVEVIAVT